MIRARNSSSTLAKMVNIRSGTVVARSWCRLFDSDVMPESRPELAGTVYRPPAVSGASRRSHATVMAPCSSSKVGRARALRG